MAIVQTGTARNWQTGGAPNTTHGLTINAGDVVVVQIHGKSASASSVADNNGANAFTKTSELTFSGASNYQLTTFTRVAGASEPSSYSFTPSPAFDRWVLLLRVFSGVDTSTPWDVAPAGVLGSGTTATYSGITTTNANSLAIFSAGANTSALVSFSGITNGFGAELERGAPQALTSYTKSIASAGAVGSTSVTFDGSYDWFAAMGALNELVSDSTAPVLSTPTGTKTGDTTASGTVSTDEGNGTLYYYASTNSSETAATIKASGSSQAVSVTGSQAVSFTGLTASTTYYAHYVHDDAAANESNVVSSASFTTDAPQPTITSIDGDNNVQAGQSNVSIVTSGIDPASVTQAVTLGGETLTINSWTDSGGNALINVDIPLHINAEWGTTHELAVTHDGGTTTLSGVTLSAPTGWETVSFATIPDTGTTESFYEYSQSDVTVGNFTAQVGDTLAFTSSTGLTIDGSSIPVVNPAATVTGSYKWWDASLSTWTPVSSYTITNLGVFGGSDTTVMIQEMISDMISEMVN